MMSHTNMKCVNKTDRMVLWMQAMVGQALSRNTPIPALNDIYVVSGPGTPELLWEVAAGAVAGTVSGMNMQGAGSTGGFKTDHTTGLEARFIAEVSHACLGMRRADANGIVLEMLKHYESTFNEPKRGFPFPEVYNEDTVEPKENWLEIYHQVRSEIKSLGLDLDNGWRRVRHG
jgi:methylamine--corrinoid protein Co-methyltransferase